MLLLYGAPAAVLLPWYALLLRDFEREAARAASRSFCARRSSFFRFTISRYSRSRYSEMEYCGRNGRRQSRCFR